jgi:hypothetical protein
MMISAILDITDDCYALLRSSIRLGALGYRPVPERCPKVTDVIEA